MRGQKSTGSNPQAGLNMSIQPRMLISIINTNKNVDIKPVVSQVCGAYPVPQGKIEAPISIAEAGRPAGPANQSWQSRLYPASARSPRRAPE